MPNWCYSQFAFTGKKESIFDLFDKIEKFTSQPRYDGSEPGPYQFGNKWLGNIVGGFGGDPDVTKCRGEIVDFDLKDDVLFVTTETAWVPMLDMWEDIILDKYPDVSFVFTAEESGMGIYVNTDTEHRFFKEKYLIDNGDDLCEYFGVDEVDKACNLLREKYGCEGETIEELVDWYNNKKGECEICLYEFEADW